MAFGGGGFGSGGFGSSNNTNTFGGGGFGSNTNSGFGTSNTTSAFGSNTNTGSSLFGGNTNNTSSPFGGGFGSNTNTNTTFGSKPFGSTTTLFGGGGSGGSTFGGFGATSNQPSTGFGSGNTGGGLFGQNKTGFGTSTTGTTGSTLFGGGSTSGGFGTSTTSGFGASSTGGFGAGATGQQPNNGTASTPFQAFEEKDGTGRQQFQTITFQQPYQHYSLEELRLVDYNQGRRYGNQNGQAGAFGQSTGFGGFGASNTNTSTGFGANTGTNTGGGLFGNANATSTPFGGASSTGFGSGTTNTGGGLFGQNKPATGLFGSTATTQPASGGLFGSTTASNTGGGFGSSFGSGNTGGGLFGQQNQTQNKTFGFGGTTTTTPAANPFGGSTNTNTFGQSTTTGGLFGSQNQTSSAPAFGSTPQTTNTGGGLFGGGAFGQTQQNQTQNQQSGGLFGGFGQNQQNQAKPSLFGSTPSTGTTGGGLFGQTNQNQQQGGGLFGNTSNQNQNQGSSLFGAKPASTGTGLFGGASTNTGTSTGGGLFGNLGTQTNQQTSGGGLFGQQNAPKTGGLFGGSTTTTNTGGGGLFGSLGQNTSNTGGLGGSLFGSQNQQTQQQSTMNNSLFGASGNSLLQTSMNTNPYGNDALFAGLSTPTQSPGPLATPLSGSQKQRKSAILPQHKLNPSQSTRLLTPQRKLGGGGGFGFSYSTYGTPGSASSAGSPSFSSSLLNGGSFGRSISKSLSTSNLRNSYTPETSILAPGAFSTSGRSFAGGSLKKLNINRSINTRPPLFDDPAPEPRKRVSFAGHANGTTQSNGVTNGNDLNGVSSGQLVLREEPESMTPGEGPTSQASSTPTLNGDTAHAAPSRPEMQQVNGKELTPVPENGALAQRTSSSLNAQSGSQPPDPTPGEYYTIPEMNDLKKMGRQQLQNVPRFVVGRHNIGRIEFNEGRPVDLSGVALDRLFGDIVQLTARNATVYGETCSVTKPARGSGLNVPSRIVLGNSWPRGYAGGKRDPGKLRIQKHSERLRRVAGTEFEQYVKETGEWIFRVPHFSSYGLNYDDFSDDEDEDMDTSELSPVPDTPAPTQLRSSQVTGTPDEESFVSPTQSSPDDTFDFKKGKRKRANVPGGYGDQVAYEEEDEEVDDVKNDQSFLGERSVGSLDGPNDEDYSDESESESDEDQDMAGSVSGPVQTTEQARAKESDPFKDSIMPKSILKPTQHQRSVFGTPAKGQLIFEDDWANQLQRTISPKKQDRQALRESQGTVLREREGNMENLAKSLNGPTIATSIDLMHSLFGETEQSKAHTKRIGHGIELPYPKRPKTAHDLDQLSQFDKEFHSCNKPHFSETGQLVYATTGVKSFDSDIYAASLQPIIGQHKDIRFTKLPTFTDAASPTLDVQEQHTKIEVINGVPFAKIHCEEPYLNFEHMVQACPVDTDDGTREQKVWELLTLLFDGNDPDTNDMTTQQREENRERFRKDQLVDWWTSLVQEDAEKHFQTAKSAEAQAISLLSGHNVADACRALLNGLDLRLATMVAQIGGDAVMRQDMATQIEEWRRQNTLSEMDDAIRAIYELLAGNCARAEGKTGEGRENKAATFCISDRFGLDWRRAFGLRLWYGTLADENIEIAVAQYADALRDGYEEVKPIPWFVEQGVDMDWQDPDATNREDILWGILKLYASSKLELPANIEDILAPQNVSGHPLNARLSFQLFQIFKARLDDKNETPARKVGMPAVRDSGNLRTSFLSSTISASEKDTQALEPLVELGDQLTLTYASSLHTPEHWTKAIFVYEHLSSPTMREHYIRTLLAQYAHTYSLDQSDATYRYLLESLRVPEAWMHAAAALQAKSEGDSIRQVGHLIKAGELEEAHDVLCRSVGPESIISRDYDALRELLGKFVPTPVNSPVDDASSLASSFHGRSQLKTDPVHGWDLGGQIFFDFIYLLDMKAHQSSFRVDEDLDHDIQATLLRLQKALEAVAKDRLTTCGLEERIALMEMSDVVANMVAEKKHRVLKLPLTEDGWLRHTQELSLGYYRAVMAGGN